MNLVGLCLCALATWRIAVLLVDEPGPWDIARRLREWIGVLHQEDGTPVSWPDKMPGSLFRCIWCISIWLSPLVVIAWWLSPVVVFVIAVAGAAAAIEGLIRGRS